MWCSHCKQDVPAQQQPPEAVLRCGVCAAVLRNTTDGAQVISGPATLGPFGKNPSGKTAATQDPARPEFSWSGNLLSDWRLDEDLEDVRRLIRRTAHRLEAAVPLDDSFSLADCLEPKTPAVPPPTPTTVASPPNPAPPLPMSTPAPARDGSSIERGSGDWTTFGGWVLVCLGAMGLVFASVLFTATMLGAKHSQPVWPLCMLSAFAGQFLVVIGFLLRHNGRRQPEVVKAKTPAVAVPAAEAPQASEPPPAPAAKASDAPEPLPRIPHSRPPWSATVEQALAAPLERQR